jgi:aspartate dehydrogenase
MKSKSFTLVGFGAIGQAIYQRLRTNPQLNNLHLAIIVVRSSSVAALQAELGASVRVVDKVPADTTLLLECAGHAALKEHVLPALRSGIECAVLSVGALSEVGLPEALEAAALQGATQVHLLSGAIGGIDAIAAAKIEGIDQLTYIGRKPPLGWKGSHAETVLKLDAISQATVFFEGTARQASSQYPKNSNVAATVALAGLGLDNTQVKLIADPDVTENIHEIEINGAFGSMHLVMKGKPLADNPRTSALTVLSALRFLKNKVNNTTL